MKPSLVAIRVDSSSQIGSGHVMRCLTLSDNLRERGADVVFVCREHVGHLCGFIEEKGYRVQRLPAPVDVCTGLDWNRHASWLGVSREQDADETLEVLRGGGPYDWLIVDHYALDQKWEQCLRPMTRWLMVIDDLADRSHDCDLLLDQNYYPDQDRRYESRVPNGCEKLLGPDLPC